MPGLRYDAPGVGSGERWTSGLVSYGHGDNSNPVDKNSLEGAMRSSRGYGRCGYESRGYESRGYESPGYEGLGYLSLGRLSRGY